MTKFEFQGTGRTTGGSDAVKAVAGVGAVALVVSACAGAAETIGSMTVIAVAAAAGLAAGVVAVLAVVCLKGRRRPAPRTQAQLWRPNPQALPPRESRAIAPAPVVNVNIGAGFLDTLLHAVQQQAQPAPVIVPAEREELPR